MFSPLTSNTEFVHNGTIRKRRDTLINWLKMDTDIHIILIIKYLILCLHTNTNKTKENVITSMFSSNIPIHKNMFISLNIYIYNYLDINIFSTKS